MRNLIHILAAFFVVSTINLNAQVHPSLTLTQDGVNEIRENIGKVELFDVELAKAIKEVDAEIEKGISVPQPEGMAGGYSHNRHKLNYLVMQKSSVLYQILQEDKYAEYVKNMLLEYAKMYPTLPLHPEERSYSRGKIFWQCLNDANWLVYTSQSYDCIYNYLSEDERKNIESNLLKPFADFLSVDTPQFFNRIHNHSTWGNVAVGMAALAMNNDELLERALYGLKSDNISDQALDNDGGLIKSKDGKAGFLANLDEPFSPDGYYTEGAYYQRYSMYPFLIFTQALENTKPEMKIFAYKDSVLIKGVYTLVNLTDDKGEFFALNDSQKGMSLKNPALVSALDIAYYYGGRDNELLDIAKLQNAVELNRTGLVVAKAIQEGKLEPFVKKSVELTDGSKGDEGAIGVLRSNANDKSISIVFKYSAHGLSHGHFDKLSFSMFNHNSEIFQDYGLARFVNIKQKNGGGYLKENKTWAKQTVAHNTLVQDFKSQYNGKFKESNKNHSESQLFSVENENIQVVSALENNAYDKNTVRRTMALINDNNTSFVIDILESNSQNEVNLDLPFYYNGQVISNTSTIVENDVMSVLGKDSGYQHLYLNKKASAKDGNVQITFKENNEFYTLTSATDTNDEILFVEIGANDPEFNLRNDSGVIIRRKAQGPSVFASVIEVHGNYSPVTELGTNIFPSVVKVENVYSDKDYTGVKVSFDNDTSKVFIISKSDVSEDAKHKLKIENQKYKWVGPFYYNN